MHSLDHPVSAINEILQDLLENNKRYEANTKIFPKRLLWLERSSNYGVMSETKQKETIVQYSPR